MFFQFLSDNSCPREDNKAEEERFAHAQKNVLIEAGIRNIANKLMVRQPAYSLYTDQP